METRVERVSRDGSGSQRIYREAARLLRAGQLVAFPTETVYGLGADGTDSAAVESIFKAKQRPPDNPLILHFSEFETIRDWVEDMPEAARRLADQFWPGPLTLVLPARRAVPSVVTAGLDTVAVRIPDHAVARRLIKETQRPVAAPSANRSGHPSPTRADHVYHDLNGKISLILDAGPTGIGVESTVLRLTPDGTQAQVLRPGGVPVEAIQKVVAVSQGKHSAKSSEAIASDAAPASPGMKYRHYAPDTPLQLIDGDRSVDDQVRDLKQLLVEAETAGMKVAVLAPSEILKRLDGRETWNGRVVASRDLGPRSKPAVAAHRLFAALRDLDRQNPDQMIAVGLPRQSMGEAVMNRLEKAASQSSPTEAGVRSPSKRILYVCTGNTCRSPMAAAITRHLLDAPGALHNWTVASAGLDAVDDQAITPLARKVLNQRQIKTPDHRSRKLSRADVDQADLVLCMEHWQAEELKRRYPHAAQKIHQLAAFAQSDTGSEKDQDIADPIGGGIRLYEETADRLQDLVLDLLKRIQSKQELTFGGKVPTMKIAVGSDHAGYELKETIKSHLRGKSYDVVDVGTHSVESVDYPDFARMVAEAVSTSETDCGILICGTGIGMSMAANKVPGVRAAQCSDVFSARASREHNDANVLTMGARVIGTGLALEIVDAWLAADFSGGRHGRRVEKIDRLLPGSLE